MRLRKGDFGQLAGFRVPGRQPYVSLPLLLLGSLFFSPGTRFEATRSRVTPPTVLTLCRSRFRLTRRKETAARPEMRHEPPPCAACGPVFCSFVSSLAPVVNQPRITRESLDHPFIGLPLPSFPPRAPAFPLALLFQQAKRGRERAAGDAFSLGPFTRHPDQLRPTEQRQPA